jgi:hypothetical protein
MGELLEEVDLESLALGRARNANGRPLEANFSRELGAKDLESLATVGPGRFPVPQIQKIRQTHHALAQLLASGMSQTEAGIITGRSTSRICLLMQDPTFMELVQYYSAMVAEKHGIVHEELAQLGKAAVHELRDRLEATPEQFSPRALLDVAQFSLDRTLTKADAPKSPGGVSVVVNFVEPAVKPGNVTVIDLEAENVR